MHVRVHPTPSVAPSPDQPAAPRLIDLVALFPVTITRAGQTMSEMTVLSDEVERLAREENPTITEGERAFLMKLKMAVISLRQNATQLKNRAWVEYCNGLLENIAFALEKIAPEQLGAFARLANWFSRLGQDGSEE